jgi:hypothetical protein
MKKYLTVTVAALACQCILFSSSASAWWPTDGGWGWGFWPSGAWPYGSAASGRQSYRAQEDALRSEGIQRADQQAQQLRADQLSEASRRGSDMQQWAAVVHRNNALQAHVDSARRFDEMRQEYLAERDRPRPPDEAAKRHKAWAENIRRQIRVAYGDLFTPAWMSAHPVIDPRVEFRNPNPYHWWNPATWPSITGWVMGTWPEPIPYDFGRNVVLKDGMVYLDGKPLAGSQDFAAHALAIVAAGYQAMAAPAEQRQQMQWLPLGVFALSPEPKGAPTIFVQLAVDKNGVIAGTYFNASTELTQAIQGAVDRTSSRAAMSLAENKDTVLEAGVWNLTQDELPVLIHFGTERSQRWLLTRMFPPRGGS